MAETDIEPGADGDAIQLAARRQINRRRGDCGSDGLELLMRCLDVGLRHENNKFFATVTSHCVALAERLAENRAERTQSDIPSRMTVRVVEDFELIHIENGDGEGLAITLGTAEFDAETIVDIATIVESGERIQRCEAQEFLASRDDCNGESRSDEHQDEARYLRRPTEESVRVRSERLAI